jgi:hypothetical protein
VVVAVVVQAVAVVVPAGKCKLLHQRCRIRSIQTLLLHQNTKNKAVYIIDYMGNWLRQHLITGIGLVSVHSKLASVISKMASGYSKAQLKIVK